MKKCNSQQSTVNSSVDRIGIVLAVLSLTLILGGCDAPKRTSTPSDVVKQYFDALVKGDYDILHEVTTPEEAAAAGGFRMGVGAARAMKDKRGKLSATHTIDEEDTDIAFVVATFENGEVINSILIKVDGKWKIHTSANEQLVSGSTIFGLIDALKRERGTKGESPPMEEEETIE